LEALPAGDGAEVVVFGLGHASLLLVHHAQRVARAHLPRGTSQMREPDEGESQMRERAR